MIGRGLTFLLTCVLVLIAATLCGCAEPAASQPETRTIVDGAGREVAVPIHVDRVVSLVTGITGILYEIDAGGKIVGVTKAQPYPTPYYYPQSDKLPDVGSIANINVEQVMSLEPDIVFTTEFFVKQAQSLVERDITVVAIRTGSLKDLVWNVKFIGSIVGQRAEAEELGQDMESTLDMIGDRTADLAREDRPDVYVEGSQQITYGAMTYCTESILKAGGVNIYGQSPIKMPQTNIEYVVEQNPDVVLLFEVAKDKEQFVDKAEEHIQEVKNRPGWETIGAVRQSRICVIENRYLNFGPDHPKSVVAMAKFFHPDLFSDISMPEYVCLASR
ncbi:MAG: ABC transporter substrate-binding protein [Chloroflexota bacterium]